MARNSPNYHYDWLDYIKKPLGYFKEQQNPSCKEQLDKKLASNIRQTLKAFISFCISSVLQGVCVGLYTTHQKPDDTVVSFIFMSFTVFFQVSIISLQWASSFHIHPPTHTFTHAKGCCEYYLFSFMQPVPDEPHSRTNFWFDKTVWEAEQVGMK